MCPKSSPASGMSSFLRVLLLDQAPCRHTTKAHPFCGDWARSTGLMVCVARDAHVPRHSARHTLTWSHAVPFSLWKSVGRMTSLSFRGAFKSFSKPAALRRFSMTWQCAAPHGMASTYTMEPRRQGRAGQGGVWG